MTIGTLSKIEPSPVALVNLTPPQMAEAIAGLDRLEAQYENMSGICATLKGLVLIEAKRKLGRGEWMPWVKRNLGAKKQKTANRYMRLAEAFSEKLDSTVQFEVLSRDLAANLEALRGLQLDLKHPVVAAVADWVGGKGAYQLMLEFGAASSKGGKTYDRGGDKGKRAAFEAKAYRALCVGVCNGLKTSVSSLRQTKSYRALNDSQLATLLHALDETSKELRVWFDKPAADRDLIFAQQVDRVARAHSQPANSAKTSRPKTKKKK
jgi:hypothetical protein